MKGRNKLVKRRKEEMASGGRREGTKGGRVSNEGRKDE